MEDGSRVTHPNQYFVLSDYDRQGQMKYYQLDHGYELLYQRQVYHDYDRNW